jgi:hypothetical protein
MSDRFIVHDRLAHVATSLRRRSTSINPRYVVLDTVTGETIDEFTTKRPAVDTARDLNREHNRPPEMDASEGFGYWLGEDARPPRRRRRA